MLKPFMLVAADLSPVLSGAALVKEKIDFVFPAPVDGKPATEMIRIIKQSNNSQQNVEVRGIFTGNYDTTKIKAESAQRAGRPPALVIMSANFITSLVLKDGILPMDELFKYGDRRTGDLLQKEFWPATYKNAQVMDTTYAIPFHNSTPILYHNKTMFDQTGIKQPPQTQAELLADAKKLADESKSQWGIILPSTNDDYGGRIFSALVRASGGEYFNEDYPGKVYYNSPTAIGTLCFWQDLVHKDKVMPPGALSSERTSAVFFSSKLGMAMLNTGALGLIRENSRNFESGVAMLPAKEQRAVPTGGANLVNFKGINEAQKKAAYQFLTYLVSPDVNGTWNRFTDYFLPHETSYDMPEMRAYLQQDPRATTVLERLKYTRPWCPTWGTVAACRVTENQLAAVANDAKAMPEAAIQAAQKETDTLAEPYADRTTPAGMKRRTIRHRHPHPGPFPEGEGMVRRRG